MAHLRREDLQIKVPALLYLSRLGYQYLTGTQLRSRDRNTNILTDTLRETAERINGTRMTPEDFGRLTGDLQSQLDADDLGKQFYGTIRNGWNGLRLIDYEHPENNLFQSASELACGSGAGSFRPDITLFVNGLPLAMIEVKSGVRSGGLLTEYDRMQERIRSREGRKYLQCAQIWAFSDDQEDAAGRFQPTEGTFFATVMADDFPVYAVRETHTGIYSRLLPENREEECRILEDNGIMTRPHTRAFQRSLSPRKPTHRMLTSLFHPERFLFLLRYGIRYIQETDPAGRELVTRRMLTTEQLSGLKALTGKAKRGYRNWTVPSCGAAGEEAANASMITLLQELEPEARLYWISHDETELRREQTAFRFCGIPCARCEKDADRQMMFLATESDLKTVLQKTGEDRFTGRRVFLLPQPVPKYRQGTVLLTELRKAYPEAVLITRTTNRIPEGSSAFLLSARTDGTLYYYATVQQEKNRTGCFRMTNGIFIRHIADD